MAQRHLFGPDYIEKTPPLEWPDLQLESTINDDTTEANINTLSFSFVGTAAEYLFEWIAVNGVFNGCPYRVEVYEGNTTELAFDGFIVLSEAQ